jgi:hypothetical protein
MGTTGSSEEGTARNAPVPGRTVVVRTVPEHSEGGAGFYSDTQRGCAAESRPRATSLEIFYQVISVSKMRVYLFYEDAFL